MLTWYQSKVKYGSMVDGKVKTVSELYLHEAVNFGEVELQCYEKLKTRIKSPDVDAVAKATFGEVIFYSGTSDDSYVADPFYRVGVESGEKYTYLVPAKDAKQAIERALKAHGYGDAHNIFEIKRTDILAVWHPHNELWQGDWWNRMELLKDLKKHSWDLNQEDLFNADGSAKTKSAEQPESDPNAITAMVIRNGVQDVEAEDLGNGTDSPTETLQPVLELRGPEDEEPTEADEETQPIDENEEVEGESTDDSSDFANTLKNALDEFGASEIEVSGQDASGKTVGKASMKKGGKLTFLKKNGEASEVA